jgi:hypothetical protein
MAKKVEQKAKPNGNGHNRVQGFAFGINLEGSENVVMEGIKAFTQAMTQSGGVLAPPVVRPVLTDGGKTAAPAAVIDQVEEPDTRVEEIPEMESAAEVEETPGSVTERKRRIPPDPKVIHDLDITAGPVPLKTFVEQKAPHKSQDRIVVVAVWLKKYKNYDEIGRDHLYTCYQQMGGTGDWKSPNDFEPLLRQLGKRKGWFDKGTGDAFKVTIVASNYVDGLPSAAS